MPFNPVQDVETAVEIFQGFSIIQCSDLITRLVSPNLQTPEHSIFTVMLALSLLPSAQFSGDWPGALRVEDGVVIGTMPLSGRESPEHEGRSINPLPPTDVDRAADHAGDDLEDSDNSLLGPSQSSASPLSFATSLELDVSELLYDRTNRYRQRSIISSSSLMFSPVYDPSRKIGKLAQTPENNIVGVTTAAASIGCSGEMDVQSLTGNEVGSYGESDQGTSGTVILQHMLSSGAVWDSFEAIVEEEKNSFSAVVKLCSPSMAYEMPEEQAVWLMAREADAYRGPLANLQGRIVPYYAGLFRAPSSNERESLWMAILEHGGSAIERYPVAKKRMTESHYEQLHQAGVIHGDVRSIHWLFNNDKLLLIDFGCCILRSDVATQAKWDDLCNQEKQMVRSILMSL